MQSCLYPVWEILRSAASTALVIAGVGLIVSWLQYLYMKKRDRDVDIRNGWTETHKLMVTFRFKRDVWKLNLSAFLSDSHASKYAEAGLVAMEALHNLKGQLDRLPDSPLVEQLANFLHDNWESEKWMSDEFQKPFDEYAKRVALLTQPATHK
jgi:hypothetical protein